MDYELKLSQEQVQVIVNALGELPLKVAAGVFNSIQQQVIAQESAAASPQG